MYTAENSGLPSDNFLIPYFLTAIAVDANNVKWIGTDGGGLVRYDGAWHLFDTTNSLIPFNFIESIYACPNNCLWIMGQKRLASFDGHQWEERSDILSTLPKTTCMLCAVDRGGRLYFATTEGRLYMWEGTSKEIPIAAVPLAGNRLSSLAMDRHNILWMVSADPYSANPRSRNICSFDGLNWTSYDPSTSPLLNNAMGTVAVDNNDTKWFAGATLCTYNGTAWRGYDSLEMGFALSGVTSLVFDSHNKPWIGTATGIATFDGARWQLFDTTNSSLPYPCVASILVDKNDTRWLIAHTVPGGWCEMSCPPFHEAVCTMDSAGFHVQDLSPFSISSSSKLACDSSGRILISVDSGIIRLDNGEWNLIKCDGIQSVESMIVDSHGSLWLTAYSGVFRLGSDGWIKIALPDSQLGGSNPQVAFNSSGNLFYSGNDLGLFVGTPDQYIHTQEKPLIRRNRNVSLSGFINPFGPMRFRGSADRSSTIAIFDLRGRLITTRPITNGKSIGGKAIRTSNGMYLYKLNAN
jgi:Predicted periplasmic ligand-binding sensor domain